MAKKTKTKTSTVEHPQPAPSRPTAPESSGADARPNVSPSLPTPERIEKVLR
ncbi:hypothetical protein [Hyphomicrobium sp.]|uniref:hypothetical protein n=1 Tax=Hyphomicrobium sp. TaxID=82 RepID=UPI003F7266C8